MNAFPIFKTATGVLPLEHFAVTDSEEQTLFVYQGEAPQVLVEVTRNAQAIPSLVGKTLHPGAAVVLKKLPVLNRTNAGPGKVTGAGLVLRNGRVVRDAPTPETEVSDREFGLAHLEETTERLRSLADSGASVDVLTTFLRSRSYADLALVDRFIDIVRRGAKDPGS